jgi:hypothetical protein
MLANAHAEENGSHMPSRRPAVFLTRASPPSHIAADSELINSAFVGSHRNRWVRGGGEGFNRRVSISVLHSHAPYLTSLAAPKLRACETGIESVIIPKGSPWDDFDKFLWLLFPKGSLWDFLADCVKSNHCGEKVTAI